MQKLKLIALRQRVVLLVLSVVLVVSQGCARGPQIEVCVLNGDQSSPEGQCAYKKLAYDHSAMELNNYVCMSGPDSERFLKNCHDRRPSVIEACVIDGAMAELDCSNGDTDRTLTWAEAMNYVCISSRHLERLLKYCSR